jgi:Ca2+:H+ antiporter
MGVPSTTMTCKDDAERGVEHARPFRTHLGFFRPSLLLLAAIPAAAALKLLTPEHHTAIFAASAVAILPLAGYIGRATETLAARLGSGVGGLLNATFGHAAELIIGALALRRGLTDLVKASLTGSIIGNVLLVFGLCALVGGIKHPPVQRFNRTAAGLGSTMLLLSAIGLTVPAVFHSLAKARGSDVELTLDTEIAVVLLVTYVASLVFTLKTHRGLYASDRNDHAAEGVWPAVAMLCGATIGVAWMSELLVGSVSEAARALGMSELFIGVIIVAIAGNAAEHYSAVQMAARNQMDVAIGIAVGSSTQIALFVAPTLVFLSYVISPAPMDLLFTVFELVAVGIAVLTITLIAHDGETHWMEGVQLLAVYMILALGFYFLPVRAFKG